MDQVTMYLSELGNSFTTYRRPVRCHDETEMQDYLDEVVSTRYIDRLFKGFKD